MYAEAKELFETAITMMQKTGNRRGEAIAFRGLGTVFISLGECVKTKEYHEKACAISIETGDREGEGACYGILGNACVSFSVNMSRLKNIMKKHL